MALAIDASTPAIVTQTNNTVATLTTASFTPPTGSVVLILWAGDALTEPTGTPTIADNLGAPLTYTQTDWKHRADAAPTVFGQAAAWTATVSSSAPMTITVTTGAVSGDRIAALDVVVLTGADTAGPAGAHGKNGSTSAAAIAQSYTAQATGSMGFLAASDFDQTGAQTAGTGTTVIGSANVGSAITYAFARRTTADGVNGASTTINTTLAGTSTNLPWVYVEIKPAAAAVSADATWVRPIPPPHLMRHMLAARMAQFADSRTPATVTGTAVAALGGATGTVIGTPTVTGTAVAALGGATGTAIGTPTTPGTAVATLGGLAATAIGTPTTPGTAAAPLGGLTATATGVKTVFGTAAAPLGRVVGTATVGAATVTGTAAATLGGLAATAAGKPTVLGTMAAPLGAAGATAVGRRTVFGTAAAGLGRVAATVAGTRSTTGTGAAPLRGLTAVVSGAAPSTALAGNAHGPLPLAVGAVTVHTVTIAGAIT